MRQALFRICTAAYTGGCDYRSQGFLLRWSDDDAKAVDMCKSCLSGNHSEFNSEICIHFSEGLEGLEKPAVFVSPKITVCLDCGHSEFSLPETELRLLGERGVPAVRKKASSSA